MKITVFLLFCSFVSILASPGYAQNTKISLTLKDATIEDALNQIEAKSDFNFLFNQKLINVNQKVDIEADNESIKEILDQILGTDIKYFVYDRQIILTPASADNSAFLQQQKGISGKVTDAANNESMPGVTVLVKGTSTGTLTDAEGKYSLPGVDPMNAILVFSFVGYGTQEVPAAGKVVIDVRLEGDVLTLDEVVVIGYGTSKRSNMIASTSAVAINEIKAQPMSRIDEALQGRTTGVVVQETNSQPNSTFNIRIRGSNSLQGSNDPLIVIDGFLGGNLQDLNPNDIASMEILKDASATAIYGSRGANGVIMITTKKGAAGGTKVEFNSYVTFQKIAKELDLMSAGQYTELVNLNRSQRGIPLPFTSQQIADYYANGGTNWPDEIYQTGIQQNEQISVSGKSNNTSFYISANIVDNKGIVKNTEYKRYSVRANIDSKLGEKMNAGLNVSLYHSMDHPVTSGRDNNPVNASEMWAPTLTVFDSPGVYTQPSTVYGQKNIYNPLALALEPIYDNTVNSGVVNTYVDYTIIKGLTAKILGAANFTDNQNASYQNTKPQGFIGDASASVRNGTGMVLQSTEQLSYTKTIAGTHTLDIVAVAEQQKESSFSSNVSTAAFLTDAVTYNNLALGSKPGIPSSSFGEKALLSYLGRINYSIAEKYYLSLSARRDGSSVFGENNKWGFFPSAAIAWRIDQESFMKQLKMISNLKLRASYGVTGNQAIPAYSSLAQLSTSMPYSSPDGSTLNAGVGFSSVANPDLKWEKTAQTNLGIDIGLFENRITLVADYYNKVTSDLLFSQPLPSSTGYSTTLSNIGKMQNSGFEFSLGGVPVSGKFSWNTNLTLSINRNKVLALLGGVNEIGYDRTVMTDLTVGFANTIYLIVGQPMGVIKAYVQDGCWGTAEAAEAAKYLVIPGAPKYVDQNSDGVINASDIVSIGNTQPLFSYSWNNTFRYKDFDLTLFSQGVQGNKIYNIGRVRSEQESSQYDATAAVSWNIWSPDNQSSNIPSVKGSVSEQTQSDRWLEDGSYFRIKTITLGYNLPKNFLSKIRISSFNIYVTGVNLFTFTKFSGYDPEARSSAAQSSDKFGGIAVATYPASKGYSVGVRIGF